MAREKKSGKAGGMSGSATKATKLQAKKAEAMLARVLPMGQSGGGLPDAARLQASVAKGGPPINIEPPSKHGGGLTAERPNWGETLMEPPFTLLIVAPRKSGKTVLLSNLVSRLLLDYNDKGEGFGYFRYKVLVSPTALLDRSASDLRREMDEIHTKYSDEIVDSLVLKSREFGYSVPMLLVLDDILGTLPRNSDLATFITKNRHYNISVAITTQHFKGVSNLIRENACGIAIFKISNDGEFKALESEMTRFDEAYHMAVVQGPPYSFLYIKIEGGKLKYFRNFDTFLFEI